MNETKNSWEAPMLVEYSIPDDTHSGGVPGGLDGPYHS
jgi:hypothetical protein